MNTRAICPIHNPTATDTDTENTRSRQQLPAAIKRSPQLHLLPLHAYQPPRISLEDFLGNLLYQ